MLVRSKRLLLVHTSYMVLEVTIVAQNIEAWNDRHFRWNSSDEVNVELEYRLDAAVGGVLVAVVLQYARICTIKPRRWCVGRRGAARCVNLYY
jgi:hypothetical protein